MPDRALETQRTISLADHATTTLALIPVWPRLYARVYLSTRAVSERPWHETVNDVHRYERALEAAVDAAERSYATTLASGSISDQCAGAEPSVPIKLFSLKHIPRWHAAKEAFDICWF